MAQQIEHWPIDKLVFYARNPRINDTVVDRMCSSIREFGFKIPVLARSDGEVHLTEGSCQPLYIQTEWQHRPGPVTSLGLIIQQPTRAVLHRPASGLL